jgi:hydrogenase maturation protease
MLIGIGNILLTDDGVGIHVINELGARQRAGGIAAEIALRDGGTIGLALLSEFQDLESLIVVDATEFGSAPGAVRVFEGAAMDAQLRGCKRTAHEVALADLMAAAELTGCAPKRRALLGIQPEKTGWGLEPTAAVAAAIPQACDSIISLLGEWRHAP